MSVENTHGEDTTGDPSNPGWAGTTTTGDKTDYWMFVRHGRWHVHDAYTGEVLGILPLVPEGGLQ